ncbi:MAG: hypothetical protein QOJ13_1958 [Gaiellales bacterium]|jgi:hypothetical protein|nr:hypothetical protein [Gaiellales bacterium]
MSGPTARRPFPLPGPVAIHVVVLGVLLYAAFLSKGPWDSDYYWHVTTGNLIANGQFPRTDPFSFTWGGMPWTLHEWLSELVIFRLVDGIGYMGAVFVFAFVPGIAMGILAFALHRLGLRTAAVVAGTSLSALLVIPYATLRPQALSWIMFAILVGGLVHLRPDRARWLLLLPPLFMVWANLHGLWVIGLVVLAVYTVLSLVGLTPMSGARRWALAMVPLAMLGTAFTPEGPSLILYPLRYVDAGDWGMANISEWQSPDFHDPAHWPLLIFMAATAIFARWRVPWWMSILSFLGIAMTLVALRNGAVAAILGAPALAVGIDAALRDWRPTQRTQSPRLARQRRVLELVMAAIVAIAGVVIFVPRDPAAAVRESIERELPVQGVELLLSEVPDGRILSWYGWGGYVIGNMYDHGARVFVDGRNDMYDDSILEEYNLVRGAEPGWEEIPDRYEVDAMLFPPFEAISKGPAVTAGWCEAYRDGNEVVFLRSCD